jgi:hypothetical protein
MGAGTGIGMNEREWEGKGMKNNSRSSIVYMSSGVDQFGLVPIHLPTSEFHCALLLQLMFSIV